MMTELKIDIHLVTKRSLYQVYFAFALICAGLLTALLIDLLSEGQTYLKIFIGLPLLVVGYILLILLQYKSKTESVGEIVFTNEKISISKKEIQLNLSYLDIKSIQLNIEGTKMGLTRNWMTFFSVFRFKYGSGNKISITTRNHIVHTTPFFLPDIETEEKIIQYLKKWSLNKGIALNINSIS